MFALVAKVFCCQGYFTDWLDILVERVNREEKSHADWTNRHILEQINREEKESTLSASRLLIKECMVRVQTLCLVD